MARTALDRSNAEPLLELLPERQVETAEPTLAQTEIQPQRTEGHDHAGADARGDVQPVLEVDAAHGVSHVGGLAIDVRIDFAEDVTHGTQLECHRLMT